MARDDNNEIQLVPATVADHDWLFDLHRQAMGPYVEAIWGWDDAVQMTFFERFLTAGNVWVIERGETPVGVLQWHDQDDHLFLAEIEVAPTHQGLGIGAAVIRQLQDQARQTARPLLLQVLRINTRAKNLYERLGFVVTGETETHLLMSWMPD